jgi:hypothetical protein
MTFQVELLAELHFKLAREHPTAKMDKMWVESIAQRVTNPPWPLVVPGRVLMSLGAASQGAGLGEDTSAQTAGKLAQGVHGQSHGWRCGLPRPDGLRTGELGGFPARGGT